MIDNTIDHVCLVYCKKKSLGKNLKLSKKLSQEVNCSLIKRILHLNSFHSTRGIVIQMNVYTGRLAMM